MTEKNTNQKRVNEIDQELDSIKQGELSGLPGIDIETVKRLLGKERRVLLHSMADAIIASKTDPILAQIKKETIRASNLFPGWPDDIIHGVAIMAEESGETVKAALKYEYETGPLEDIETEAIQTAAMCVRVLLDLEGRQKNKGKDANPCNQFFKSEAEKQNQPYNAFADALSSYPDE